LAGCASSLPVGVAKAYLRLYYLHIAFDRPDSSRIEVTLAYIVSLGKKKGWISRYWENPALSILMSNSYARSNLTLADSEHLCPTYVKGL
jgi:hypothetical protein